MSDRLGILVPVWPGYRWIAPFTARLLDEHWPSHPPVRFGGLTAAEAGELPALPHQPEGDRKNWTLTLREAVRHMRAEGFTWCYLVAEEHVPLAPCAEEHLNKTLPALAREIDAVYMSLMGWDNRRYTSKSPVVGARRLKHLCRTGDPRFHLHPALWRLDVLEACCDLALQDPAKNGSAWHFEKVNDSLTSPHPEKWKQQCYQICGDELASPPRSVLTKLIHQAGCFVYHKLMALYPLIPRKEWANAYAKFVGFDNFLYRGPYPMFYSGLMAKGTLNAYFVKFAERSAQGRALLEQLRQAQAAFRSSSPA